MKEIKKLFLEGKLEKFHEAVKSLKDSSEEKLLKILSEVLKGKEYKKEELEKLEKDFQNDSENLSWIGLIYTITNNLQKAKEILQKAISLENVSAYAYFRLANIYILTNELEKAKELMLKGLEIEEKAEAYYNLGFIYTKLEDKKAIEYYKKAWELKPFSLATAKKTIENLEKEEIEKLEEEIEEKLQKAADNKEKAKYLAMLGIFKYLNKEYEDGLIKLNQAINLYEEDEELRDLYIEFMLKEERYWILGNKLKKWVKKYDRVKEHLALAECRIEANFLEKAKEGLDGIKDRIKSEMLDYKLLIARYYKENNEYDKAKELLENLLKEYPNYPPLIISLSDLYKQLGELDKSLELLEKIEDHIGALIRRVDVKKVEKKDVEKLEEYFETIEDEELKANVAFSLASGYDKLKDYKKASFYIKKANDLIYKKLDYSIEEFRKEVDTLINAYTKEWVIEKQNTKKFDKRPIFIVGMPRSGTTMLEQIFAAHNKVFGAGELPFIQKIINLSEKITNRDYPYSFLEADKKLIAQAGEYYIYLTKKMYHFSEPIFVDKLPHNFLHSPLLVAMFADSKIIALRRDYRSIALSNYFQNFAAKRGTLGYAFDIKAMAEHIKDYIRIMDYYKSILPEDRYKEFWYEDLVLNPKEKIPEVLEFCELDFTPEVLEFYKNKTAIKTASVVQVRNPIYTKSLEKYKNYEELLKPLIEIVGKKGMYNPTS